MSYPRQGWSTRLLAEQRERRLERERDRARPDYTMWSQKEETEMQERLAAGLGRQETQCHNHKERKETAMPVDTQYTVTEGMFELFPADVYDCKLTDINRKLLTVTNNDGVQEQAYFLEWEFTIIGGEFAGKTISDVAREYANLGPKSKMRAWIEGITGQLLAGRTEPVNPNKLIGRACRVNLSRGPNSRGRDTNKIVSLLPSKKAAPASDPKPAAAAAATPADDDGLF